MGAMGCPSRFISHVPNPTTGVPNERAKAISLNVP
jgi:hypothetical protein